MAGQRVEAVLVEDGNAGGDGLLQQLVVADGDVVEAHPLVDDREGRAGVGRRGQLRALAQDEETRAQYPYSYEAEYSVWLLPRGLQVELLVRNTGDRALPASPGWHPYFNCPAQAKGAVRASPPG